ncbi:MAG: hypothetical protein H7Z17_06855 [Fuerstia sp.]|nr:hypothetical protein [Fuerstiella sp.]
MAGPPCLRILVTADVYAKRCPKLPDMMCGNWLRCLTHAEPTARFQMESLRRRPGDRQRSANMTKNCRDTTSQPRDRTEEK